MSIIAEALKKAQKHENPNVSSVKITKQPTFGPKPEGYKKTKTSFVKKNNFILNVLIISLLLLIAVTSLFSTIQNSRRTYAGNQKTPVFYAVNPASLPDSSVQIPASQQILEQKPLFRLSGIVYDEMIPLAVVNDSVVKKGEIIDGAKVAEITDDSVILHYNGKKTTLYLSK
ncbi:MAG: hypothetical protein ABH836_07535 [Candidatus Omnitrophota bacterium]